MEPKWRTPEPGENEKRSIDGVPHTRNTATNRWDKDAAPLSGLVTPVLSPAAAASPQSSAWQSVPAAPSPSQAPFPSDTKIGGALLTGVHGNIGQNIQVVWDNLLRHNWLPSMPMSLHLPLSPRKLNKKKYDSKCTYWI